MYFREECHSNATHAGTTDLKALRKGWGKEVRLGFLGHALMENCNSLLMDFMVSSAIDTALTDRLDLSHPMFSLCEHLSMV